MPSPPPGYKTCFRCGVLKPVDQFLRRTATLGGRTRDCRACHAKHERIRKNIKRVEKHDKQKARDLRAALVKLKDAETDAKVRIILDRLSVRMGGFAGLLDYWADAIGPDLEKGGFVAWRHIGAVLRLIEHVERTQTPPSEMSDEELEDRLAELDAQVSRV